MASITPKKMRDGIKVVTPIVATDPPTIKFFLEDFLRLRLNSLVTFSTAILLCFLIDRSPSKTGSISIRGAGWTVIRVDAILK